MNTEDLQLGLNIEAVTLAAKGEADTARLLDKAEKALYELEARLATVEAQAAARILEYENALAWETNCLNCAKLLDSSYAETVRAEKAEAQAAQLAGALEQYADPNNWTREATWEYMTGAVRSDGYEEEATARVDLDSECVWQGDGESGWETAEKALTAYKAQQGKGE